MSKKLLKLSVFIFLSIFSASNASAKTDKTLIHKQLLQRVVDYVDSEVNPQQLANIKVKAMPFDTRVNVSLCQDYLTIAMAKNYANARQFPVKVSCSAPNRNWKVFVNVSVQEMVETLVAVSSIAKGTRIDESMVKLTFVDKYRIKNRSTTDLTAIVGGRTLRNIPRGYQIAQRDVCLVCKGDDVAIIAQMNNMMIKTSGTAIENGSKGDTIKVKNNRSERLVKGVIGELREIYVKL